MNVIDAMLVEVDALMAELGALFPDSSSLADSINWIDYLQDESLRTNPPHFLKPWFERVPFPFETELLELAGLRFQLNETQSPKQVSLFDWHAPLLVDAQTNIEVAYKTAVYDPDRPEDFVGVRALRWARWAFRQTEWNPAESAHWSEKGMLCAKPGTYYGVEVPVWYNNYHRWPVLCSPASPLSFYEQDLADLPLDIRISQEICQQWIADGCPVE